MPGPQALRVLSIHACVRVHNRVPALVCDMKRTCTMQMMNVILQDGSMAVLTHILHGITHTHTHTHTHMTTTLSPFPETHTCHIMSVLVRNTAYKSVV
jgi:hypothetical protein